MRIKVQRFISYLSFPLLGLIIAAMWLVKRYRIENHRALRRQFRTIARDRRPLIICSNHLTYLDPCLIVWALAWHFSYLLRFRLFTWNLAAVEYQKSFAFRIIGYLAKCIFIDRSGSRDHHQAVLDQARALVRRGEVLNIFPEGKRSRTGRFHAEKLTHGVGKIIAGLEDCRVLCIYLRGDKDDGHAGFPAPGSRFYLKMEVITPRFTGTGREAYHEIVSQIGATLSRLEQEYFERREAASANHEKAVVTGTSPIYT